MKAAQGTSQGQRETRRSLGQLVALINERRDELSGQGADQISEWLYGQWYTRRPQEQREPGWPEHAPPIAAALRAVVDAPRYWQSGWVALEVDAHQRCLAGRGLSRRWADPGDFANLSRPGAPAAPGDHLAVFQLLTWVDPPTGFIGLRAINAAPVGPLVRLYWSVAVDRITAVVPRVVATLEDAGAAWLLKCPSQPEAYARVDTLVIYLERSTWRELEAPLLALSRDMAGEVRDLVPPLTLRLGAGLGFAEDPDPARSYGQTRCDALAGGVHEWLKLASAAKSALPILERSLRRHGIDLAAPWRSPAGAVSLQQSRPQIPTVAELPSDGLRRPATSRRGSAITTGTPSPRASDPFLAAAIDIARELQAEVLDLPGGLRWQGDDLVGSDPQSAKLVHGETGTGLYAGSAGIGWFLAHLGEHVGDAAMRDLGARALADAVDVHHDAIVAETMSLYGGASGVALCALQASRRLQHRRLNRAASALMLKVAGAVGQGCMPAESDLIGGSAGLIVALAACRAWLSPKAAATITAACVYAGERLAAEARREVHGVTWPEAHASHQGLGLCGLAHGNAGIAWALAEVARLSGEGRWNELADEATRYERGWFDAATSSWPDLRAPAKAGEPLATMTAWCHGGIGIAASRLRLMSIRSAVHVGQRAAWLSEVNAALNALRRVVSGARRSVADGRAFDVSLCHGLGGAVELFTLAERSTGTADHGRAARQTAQLCLKVPRLNAGRWTSGVSGASHVPGLMTGLAGIAVMLLRVHAPRAIATPLLPGAGP